MDEAGGIALPDACVVAFDLQRQIQSIDVADGSGVYALMNLEPGEYTIWFLPCHSEGFHLAEWYDGRPDIGAADAVTVTSGQETTGIDASLAAGGGSASGTVLEEGAGVPLINVCVLALADPGGLVSMGISNGSGDYSVGGLPEDAYSLAFIDCLSPITHVIEWYNDGRNPGEADGVSVGTAQKTAGINASLTVGAYLRGIVEEAGTRAPLPGICVEAYDTGGNFRGLAVTDTDGSYIVGGVPRGDQRVVYYDCETPLFHINEWYNDQPDFTSATPVPVGGPRSTRNGVSATLAVGGSISGTVTAVDRTPLPGLCVDAYDTSFLGIASGLTDSSGAYEIGGLPAADAKIWFRDCRSSPTYISQWYAGYSFDSAGLVAVVQRRKSPGINGELAPGSTINGTVTEDETHAPLQNICVYVYSVIGRWIAFDRTDRLGTYAVVAHFGDHSILFADCALSPSHNPEWYDNKLSFDSADLIHIDGPGSKVAGIDAGLALGLAGDGDCDRSATSIDAALLLQLVAGLLDFMPCAHNVDMNGDGDLTSVDAAIILQIVAGLV